MGILESNKAGDLSAGSNAPIEHAVALVHRVCCLAGLPNYLRSVRASNGRVRQAIVSRNTPALFDWLVETLNFQGISNQIARAYLNEHGSVTWADIERSLALEPACSKLQGYWRFSGCGFQKSNLSCSEPELFSKCPLPTHPLRNGRLNQAAYSLYFFMRDVADSDFVGWIDTQLSEAAGQCGTTRTAELCRALLHPLRHVYGVSDKVLSMALSSLLLSAPQSKKLWIKAGSSMLAVDTLVHNFLHRTGLLDRFDAQHLYGPACYANGGCADIVEALARRIDARQFNARFPALFPRFVQHAIWRFCAEGGFDICNGNQIDDNGPCKNLHCQVGFCCDRIALRKPR